MQEKVNVKVIELSTLQKLPELLLEELNGVKERIETLHKRSSDENGNVDRVKVEQSFDDWYENDTTKNQKLEFEKGYTEEGHTFEQFREEMINACMEDMQSAKEDVRVLEEQIAKFSNCNCKGEILNENVPLEDYIKNQKPSPVCDCLDESCDGCNKDNCICDDCDNYENCDANEDDEECDWRD